MPYVPLRIFMDTGIAAVAAVMFAAVSPASAQPRLPVKAGEWNVDYGNVRCSLGRRLGGANSPVLILSSYLGRDEPEFIILRDGNEPLPELPARVQVVLVPSNALAEGVMRKRQLQGGTILTITGLGEGFIDRFASSAAVRLQAGRRQVVQLAIPGAARAVAALRACNDDLLRSWGVDPAAPVNRPAKQISGSISWEDYPNESASNDETGTVVTRFTVTPEGGVINCGVVVTSGHRRLDGHTCGLISQRFRYQPALGKDDRPVATIVVRTVTWLLPN
jgi:TonB family protein